MSNTLLTVDYVTKKAVSMFVNSNAFLQTIDRRYEKEYGQAFKIGSTLRIRLPLDYPVGLGATVTPSATNEQFTTLTVGTQSNVSMSFTSAEFALQVDDMTDRMIAKATNDLAAVVAQNVMSIVDCGNAAIGATIGVPNFVSNVNGSNDIISPIANTWLRAGAALDKASADRMNRTSVLSPDTQANTVSSFSGLFNPTTAISEQYKQGTMGGMMAFGIKDWRLDQTVLAHTTGTATAMTVNGANQTGTSITVHAISGTIAAGDIITFGVGGTPVNSVNRLTKASNNSPATFVVTSAVANGGTTINIYPAMTPPSGATPVAYQTVTASPLDSAAVNFVSQPGEVYWKNMVYKPECFTLVTADLPLPNGKGVEAARANYDGISLRVERGYQVLTDVEVTRMDILYGACLPKPDWAVIVADQVS